MLFCFCIDVVYMFSPVSVSLFFYRTLTTLVFIFFVSVSGLLCASTFLRLFCFFVFFLLLRVDLYFCECNSFYNAGVCLWFFAYGCCFICHGTPGFRSAVNALCSIHVFLCVYLYYFNINVFCCYMFRYLFCCFLKIFKQ